jgi:hypothetical protein
MIAAFDMGLKNFAFAVKDEEDKYTLLRNIALSDSLNKTILTTYKKKDLTTIMTDLQIPLKNKMLKTDMIALILSKNKKKEKNNPIDLGLNLFKIMDSYKHVWDKCETFLIERQMIINMQALKLSHYLEAYLKIHYPLKKILNYNASTKTKKLGAIDLNNKADRKKWTIQYTLQLLDGENLTYFQNLTKQDDVADVVCMIESFITDPASDAQSASSSTGLRPVGAGSRRRAGL